jgi:hypothetical protein
MVWRNGAMKALSNEQKEMYDKNLKSLNKWLRDSVQKINEQDLWDRIDVEYNDDGYPVCLYNIEGGHIHITSENPVREAEMWYKANADMEGCGTVFLCGCGFGYPVFEIFNNKMSHTLVIVFEEDVYLFKAMLYYFDLRPVIESGKFIFFIGGWDYFINVFESLFFGIFILSTSPAVVYTHTARRNFKDRYNKIIRELVSYLCLMVLYIGNDHKDNMIGLINIMKNVKHIIENPYISCLKDKYKGYPAFVIANGPSLDKNIQHLKDIGGRGLIICMESAIIPLLRNGIKPDILVVIERLKASYIYHFRDVKYPDGIALLGLAQINSLVFDSFPGEKLPIFRDREFLNIWLCRYLGDGSVIDAGVNVSHLATEIALYLGADPIIFAGQDFAYGEDDATHSKSSIYSEERGRKSMEFIRSIPSVYLEGNDGAPVRSNEMWAQLKEGLELKISAHTDRHFINATEGGAKIKGTLCERLENAVIKHCVKKIYSQVNALLKDNRERISADDRKKGLERLIKNVELNIQALRGTVLEAAGRKHECNEILHLLGNNENGKYNQIIEEAYQRNIASIERIAKVELIIGFAQQIMIVNYYSINSLKKIDTEEKIDGLFKIHRRFFNQLCVICQSVSVHIEDSLISLKNELERLNDVKGSDEE